MRLLICDRGHYDILYKAEDFPAPVTQAPLHVALATGYNDEFVPMATNMPDVMTLIPGMYPTGIGQRWPSVSYDYNPNPTPQPHITPVPTYAPSPSSAGPIPSSHHEYAAPVPASHVNHHNSQPHHIQMEQPPITLPIHPAPAPPPLTIERGPPMPTERGGPFRPSVYELEPGFGCGQLHSIPFQTSIFRKYVKRRPTVIKVTYICLVRTITPLISRIRTSSPRSGPLIRSMRQAIGVDTSQAHNDTIIVFFKVATFHLRFPGGLLRNLSVH